MSCHGESRRAHIGHSPSSWPVDAVEFALALALGAAPELEFVLEPAPELVLSPELLVVPLLDPEPSTPPVAPVAAMRASASACVVHAIDVPAEFTSGSAKHCVPPAQPVATNAPPTHWAKPPATHAFSPAARKVSGVFE